MEFIVSTLAKGGFSNDEATLYALLINQYVYIGITGTSNKTGRSSPIKRLGSHVTKRGNTKSVFWDDLFNADNPKKDLLDRDSASVKMLSCFVPEELSAARIERAAVDGFRKTLKESQTKTKKSILRNKTESCPKNILPKEAAMAVQFVDKVLKEREKWIASEFGSQSAN